MKPLFLYLSDCVQQALEKSDYAQYGQDLFLKPSDRPDLSDYQSSLPLVLARALKKNPQEIAGELSDFLKDTPAFRTFVAGPGFLNFSFTETFLYDLLQKGILVQKEAVPQNIIVDYGGPNIAKPLHVGHLRSSIIGESLKRILRHKGHHVLGDIHMGDWGTQMGMLIIALKEKYPDLPYFDASHTGDYPTSSPVSLDDLQEIYPDISARCKENDALAEAARQATFELQSGRPGYRALWQHFVRLSVEDMKQNFDRLDVSFDQWFGESRYQDHIPFMIEDYQQKGFVRKSDGALVIDVMEPQDKKEIPPLILQKKDGGFLYATTDLATIEERVGTFRADRIVYVVDARQSLHFEQVFRAARKVGHTQKFDFIGFGTMNGPDNKPFKTRSGGAMRLEDLIQMLTDEAQQRLSENNTSGHRSVSAEIIGVAALKFADLQHNPTQNYQFDLKKFTSFEGKTGPYILYALVRIFALLERALPTPYRGALPQELSTEERALMIKILQQEEYIQRAAHTLSPHILCDYAFELAQEFSRFYAKRPIHSEADESLKQFRLNLCAHVKHSLLLTLNLLGIRHVEKM